MADISLGNERLTVTTGAAVGFASIPAGSTRALVRVLTASINFTEDGVTTPTTTAAGVGQLGAINDIISLTTDPKRFKAIAQTATATLVVTYYMDGA